MQYFFVLNIFSDIIHDVTDKHDRFDLSGDRTVSEMTGFSYCSEGWTYGTTF